MSTFTKSAATDDEIRRRVDEYLGRYVKGENLPANLEEAVLYAVLSPGKRIRPLLVLRSCEALGGELGKAYPAAAAIEMIHAFSLIHDDLPALDNDDLRRGRPTVHVRFGEAMAVLAGDYLNSVAFAALAAGYPGEVGGRLCSELSGAATAMIAGQVYDTLGGFPENLSAKEKLDLIHRNKTGALIRCSCRMGAICAGADALQLEQLTKYAEAVGLMFQVVDDVLDETQSAEQMGKRTHKDAEAGKLTYPGLFGLEGSRTQVRELEKEALTAIETFGDSAEPLRELCRLLAVRTK